MAYDRYPRDDQSNEEYRRSYGGDRNRFYQSGDDFDAGQRYDAGQRHDAGLGHRYGGERSFDRNRDGRGGTYQRGYYSAGDSFDRGSRYGGDQGGYRGPYGARGGYGRSEYDRSDPARGDAYRGNAYRGQNAPSDYDYDERGFLTRAGDEVRSWFGDDEAERRRQLDQRYDEQRSTRPLDARDEHYSSWRAGQIAALDRDYDEYRRENQQRFHSEFDTWRTDRQGQRSALSLVNEHMDVVGSDGEHVGTVDKVRGDRIILTKSDADAGGHHHSIPSRWIDKVDDKVMLRKSAEEAKTAWRDEDRGALFGDDRAGDQGRILNKSFSGTY